MVDNMPKVVKPRGIFSVDTRRMTLVLIILLLIIVGLLGTLIGLIATRPAPGYYSVTDTGRTRLLIGRRIPNLSSRAILRWASAAVVSAYTYNYVNFPEVFKENRKYFTRAGWKSFTSALTASENLDMVKKKKLIMSAVLAGAPVITNQYMLSGRYTWKVQVPVFVTFESMSELNEQRYLVMLTITRISTMTNLHGIGISEFYAEQI